MRTSLVWTPAIAITATLLFATPAHAEAPSLSREATQRTNVQRLLVLNECMDCNLSGTDLAETAIIGADLRGADLSGANLASANLEGTDFSGAILTGANLSGAYLTNANLTGATLIDVDLSNATIVSAIVQDATLENVNLAGAQVLYTPISTGGEEEILENGPSAEPVIPFEETQPPVQQFDSLLESVH